MECLSIKKAAAIDKASPTSRHYLMPSLLLFEMGAGFGLLLSLGGLDAVVSLLATDGGAGARWRGGGGFIAGVVVFLGLVVVGAMLFDFGPAGVNLGIDFAVVVVVVVVVVPLVDF